MMKKMLLSLALVSLMTSAFAQTNNVSADSLVDADKVVSRMNVAAPTPAAAQLAFGYLSYDEVLRSMPDYAIAVKTEADLRAKYDAEVKRVENDFNSKYESFLEGQRDFPESIRQKRQAELQDLLDKNIKFREESRRLLAAARKDIFAPLHAKLSAALMQIGTSRGYAFILNTDNNTCPFINAASGVDITADVKAALAR